MMTKKRSIYSILFFITASLFLAACSSSTDGGLITDALPVTDCPQNSCAQGVADVAETKILLQTPISNAMPVGSTFAEVSGECYASLYPQNFIEVSVSMNNVPVTNFFPAGFTPRCNQGKFYLPINLQGAPNGTYNLSARLVVQDAQGVQSRNQFAVISSLLIKR